MQPNRKQFIIFKEKLILDGFESLELSNGLFLSYECHLKLSKLKNGIIILGDAVPLVADAQSRLDLLGKGCIDSLANIMQYFSGRWVAIWGNIIVCDACALLSLFWAEDCVSSSLNLIYNHTLHKQINPSYKEPVYGSSVDWVVAPGSPISGIKRMLCSQYLEFDEKNGFYVHHYDFISPLPSIDDNTIFEKLIQCFDMFFRSVEKEYASLVLPVTAGVDSRSLLALMIHSGVKFSTFTFERKMMKRSDHTIPETITNACGIPYRFIRMSENDDSLRHLWKEHTFGACASEDENFLAHKQFFAIPESSLLIRGNVWELTSCVWWKRLGKANNINDIANHIKKSMPEIRGPFFEEWITDLSLHPRTLDWRDILFHEQRCGAWLGSIEQSLDILPFSHLVPTNSSYILSLLLSLPPEVREGKAFQKRIIDKLVPTLSSVAYNQKSLVEKIRHYLNKLKKKLNAWRSSTL